MRDPARIHPFCDRLAELWEKVPDWRFGQLVSNLLGDIEAKTKKSVFYMEDEELFSEMEKLFAPKDK